MERPRSGNACARMDPGPSRRRGFVALARVSIALLALAGTSLTAAANAAPSTHTGPSGHDRFRFAETVFPGAGGEPNVSISPDGKTVLVDGLGGSAQGNDQPAALWRSTDGGTTFTRIKPHFDNTGGGDFDMRWLDDHTVVAADLSIGNGIYVDRSTDGGLHWTQTQIAEDQYDRPWLAVFKNNVYVIAKGFDGIPYCYTSTDGGRSFSPQPIPLYGIGADPNPVDSFVTNQNAYVDHAATDPVTGQLYVLFGIDDTKTYSQSNPVGVPDRLYVARLDKGPLGPQFTVLPVYEGGSGDGFINGFNWLTVDRAGTIYALGNGLHAGHQSMWLSSSTDKGAHWSKLVDVGEAGANSVYGSIAAGSNGTLALVYLRGTKTDPNQQQDWYVETAQILHANSPTPLVVRDRPVTQPIHTHDICMSGILCGVPGFGNDRNLLDYIWDAVAPNGTMFAVTASDGPATGSHGVDVVLVRQTGGPSFGPGVPS
jgi:hypothetical protein